MRVARRAGGAGAGQPFLRNTCLSWVVGVGACGTSTAFLKTPTWVSGRARLLRGFSKPDTVQARHGIWASQSPSTFSGRAPEGAAYYVGYFVTGMDLGGATNEEGVLVGSLRCAESIWENGAG